MENNPERFLDIYSKRPTDINEHLYTIYYLTLMLQPRTVLEIGCGDGGGSTLAIRLASHHLGAKHFTIDIAPSEHTIFRVNQEYQLSQGWTFRQGDSTQLGKSWDIPLDMLFIDSSHKREDTIAEIALYEPHVRDGGILIFHDTGIYYGVLEPIQQFLKRNPDYAFYNYEHNSGLGVLRKNRPLPIPIMKLFEPEMKLL